MYTFTFIISQQLACTHYFEPWTSGTKFQISYHVLVTHSKPSKVLAPVWPLGLWLPSLVQTKPCGSGFTTRWGPCAVSTQYGAVPRMITVTQIILGGGKYVLSHSLALNNQAPTVVITWYLSKWGLFYDLRIIGATFQRWICNIMDPASIAEVVEKDS